MEKRVAVLFKSCEEPATVLLIQVTVGTYIVWGMPMLHWEGCEVTLLVGTSVCIGWFRSILQGKKQCVSKRNLICAVIKYQKN